MRRGKCLIKTKTLLSMLGHKKCAQWILNMPRTTCHGTTSRSPGSYLCWVTETTVSPLLLSLLTDLDQCPVLSPVDTLHSVLEHYTFKHPTCPVSLIYLARTGLISLRHPQGESDIVLQSSVLHSRVLQSSILQSSVLHSGVLQPSVLHSGVLQS